MKLLILAICLLFAACSPPKSEPQTVTLDIEGMTCEACVNGITAQLKKTPGVLDCTVNLEGKSAVVSINPGQILPEQTAQRVNQLGFKAQVKTP
jgi:Cu+-exporting ATPase